MELDLELLAGKIPQSEGGLNTGHACCPPITTRGVIVDLAL